MNDGGKNDPLPVKSQEQAEQAARGLIDSLAAEYGVKADGKTVNKEFRDCHGKDGESSDDGRFILSYAVRAPVPEAEHGKAVRAMRRKLEADGYKVSGYREDKTKKPWALLDAKGGRDRLFISVQSYVPPDQLTFSVTTPCFLPPGVKQEQVSAPAPATASAAVPTTSVLAAGPGGSPNRFPDNPFG
ncbi:hypothetical protein [Streptomyces paromomycinus]|uniref:Uncharacterized protein n=1 Tax=Streptomyces paromomycinus TaxID=92743 RepID=A0A401W9A8_STREY|nr:hypothetical protein [Streptomyces paromomycinus]GCD45907.1 hypothetical protein GKJPGBOP_05650 [Streptomyces paromomycinus]